MTEVVTVFLQHDGEVLLLRRSEAVGTYQRQWGGVSGYVEPETDDPREDAERELREEIGAVDAALRRRGDPLHSVTLTTDGALPSVVSGDVGPSPDAALVGADAVLPDGDVVNKVGTRPLALAAERAGLPLYVVAARDKIATEEREPTEEGDPDALYDGESTVAVENPVFDRTPAECVATVVTEDGALDADALEAAVQRHREHAAWDSEPTSRRTTQAGRPQNPDGRQ